MAAKNTQNVVIKQKIFQSPLSCFMVKFFLNSPIGMFFIKTKALTQKFPKNCSIEIILVRFSLLLYKVATASVLVTIFSSILVLGQD